MPEDLILGSSEMNLDAPCNRREGTEMSCRRKHQSRELLQTWALGSGQSITFVRSARESLERVTNGEFVLLTRYPPGGDGSE
jgi:hypothetical protein